MKNMILLRRRVDERLGEVNANGVFHAEHDIGITIYRGRVPGGLPVSSTAPFGGVTFVPDPFLPLPRGEVRGPKTSSPSKVLDEEAYAYLREVADVNSLASRFNITFDFHNDSKNIGY